ncbi:MAG: HNH endonuclease [Clostridia bacterium]|nr:HNH endonuclease [Clostridia bacterium]
MRDEFARAFYSSRAWASCRDAYKKKRGNLCEICAGKGEIRPAEEVHHKIRLTPRNIDDASVTLNWENLQALCGECHKAAHKRKRRYRIDESGRLRVLDTPHGGDGEGRGAPTQLCSSENRSTGA